MMNINDEHIHNDDAALLDYLYDEGEPAARLKVARHLQACAACSVAVLELRAVRGLLSEWTPPVARLGFRIVPEAPGPAADLALPRLRGQSRGWLGDGWATWAQAAAGMLLFAAGMGFSQLHVEYGGGAVTVRARSGVPMVAASTRRQGDVTLPAMPVESASVTGPSAAPSGGPSGNLAALEQTLRAELASDPTSRSASADEVLRRVKTLIDQSESRQQRELALRVAQVVNDFDTQRRADLLRVEQNFGQLEGQTGAEVAQQREMFNSLVKVSQGGVK
jgi:hypothetical protein